MTFSIQVQVGIWGGGVTITQKPRLHPPTTVGPTGPRKDPTGMPNKNLGSFSRLGSLWPRQNFGGALISGQKGGDSKARWNRTNPQVQPGQARGGGRCGEVEGDQLLGGGGKGDKNKARKSLGPVRESLPPAH